MPTPTADLYIYATLTGGQMTRFDYTASAGSVMVANMLFLLLVSLWAFFLFGVFIWRRKRSGSKP